MNETTVHEGLELRNWLVWR